MQTNPNKYFRILSIDGGGIRGVVPAQILVEVEKIIQQKTGNKEAKLGEYFDMIAGTSTGGILTSIFLKRDNEDESKPQFSAQDALNLYLDYGDKIFDLSLWQRIKTGDGLMEEKYNPKPLEDALEKYLGDTKLSDLYRPCLITAYNIKDHSTMFFNSYEAKKSDENDFYMKDVTRSTSAAPSYFEMPNIKSISGKEYPLLDGGVFANNPAMCAFSEALKNSNKKLNPKKVVVFSLGVGRSDSGYDYDLAIKWNLFEWLKPLSEMMRFGINSSVDFQLEQIFDTVNERTNYLRIDPIISESSHEIDDASSENMKGLRLEGMNAFRSNQKEIEGFVDKLLKKKNLFSVLIDKFFG